MREWLSESEPKERENLARAQSQFESLFVEAARKALGEEEPSDLCARLAWYLRTGRAQEKLPGFRRHPSALYREGEGESDRGWEMDFGIGAKEGQIKRRGKREDEEASLLPASFWHHWQHEIEEPADGLGMNCLKLSAEALCFGCADPKWREGFEGALLEGVASAESRIGSSKLVRVYGEAMRSVEKSVAGSAACGKYRAKAAEAIEASWRLFDPKSQAVAKSALENGICRVKSIRALASACADVQEKTPHLFGLGCKLIARGKRVAMRENLAATLRDSLKALGLTEGGWRAIAGDPDLAEALRLAPDGATRILCAIASESAAGEGKDRESLLEAGKRLAKESFGGQELEELEKLSELIGNQPVSIKAKTIEAAERALQRAKASRAARSRAFRQACQRALEVGWREAAGEWSLMRDWKKRCPEEFQRAASGANCSWAALMRRQGQWHKEELDRELKERMRAWEPCLGEEIAFGEGELKARELCSALELHEEGQRMRHCVGTYDKACAAGKSAIFSIRREGYADDREATLEIARRPEGEWRVAQIRGVCNNQASERARAFAEEIARRATLEAQRRKLSREGELGGGARGEALRPG